MAEACAHVPSFFSRPMLAHKMNISPFSISFWPVFPCCLLGSNTCKCRLPTLKVMDRKWVARGVGQIHWGDNLGDEWETYSISFQIRFVFQSSSGHIPYWLKPNNLIRCSPPPFSSPTAPLPPPPFPQCLQRETTSGCPLTIKEELTAHHSSWPQSWAFNFDDIYQS